MVIIAKRSARRVLAQVPVAGALPVPASIPPIVRPAASGGGLAYASAAGTGAAGSCIGGGAEGAMTNKPNDSGPSQAAFETLAFLKFTLPMMNRRRGKRL